MSRFVFALNSCVAALAFGAAAASLPFSAASAAGKETAAEVAKEAVIPPKPARLADGHPNWTGFWVPLGGLLEVNIGLGGTPPPPPPGVKLPPMPPFPLEDYPPLKSPYKERYQAFRIQMAAGKMADPIALCLPPGMPRMMVMGYGMELLQTPGQIAMISEVQAEFRHVWLDRTTHPSPDELDPTYAGDSIGHWEGDTLVVDTVGIRNDVPLNYTGLPHGPKLHVVERLTETKPGILVDNLTIIDPDMFPRPWHTSLTYRYRPDLRIEEYVCLENNRNVGSAGEATFSK